jgi:hypothetical protein
MDEIRNCPGLLQPTVPVVQPFLLVFLVADAGRGLVGGPNFVQLAVDYIHQGFRNGKIQLLNNLVLETSFYSLSVKKAIPI